MEYQNHFFSYRTHVSAVLPVGWEEFEEGEKSVTYIFDLADVLDEDELINEEGGKLFNPKWIIELFAIPDSSLKYLEDVSKALLMKPRQDFNPIRHESIEVDGCPGICDEFLYREPDYKGQLIQHQSFVLVDNVLFSFSGVIPKELKEEFASAFDDALQSVRFILPDTHQK